MVSISQKYGISRQRVHQILAKYELCHATRLQGVISKIRELTKNTEISLKELSLAVGKNPSYVNNLKNRSKIPYRNRSAVISKALRKGRTVLTKELLQSEINSGLNLSEIARKYSYSQSAIWNYAQRTGVEYARRIK